jgi:hypothetical protein
VEALMPARITDPEGITRLMARYNRKWGRSKSAYGECFTASVRLGMAMHERGLTGAALLVAEWDLGNHFAVEHDHWVYDLTIRQFDPDLDFPTMLPRADWEALMRDTIAGIPMEFRLSPLGVRA